MTSLSTLALSRRQLSIFVLGLGLSLVRRICEANGWVVRLQGRDGGGTQASVRLGR